MPEHTPEPPESHRPLTLIMNDRPPLTPKLAAMLLEAIHKATVPPPESKEPRP